MGNCLVVLQEGKTKKVIKIMMVDGSILEYQSPLKVHQALSKFPGHSISELLPVVRRLDRDADMVSGILYYLVPPKAPVEVVETGRGTSMVRIKLVVSKQELKEMLSKGGVSLGDVMSQQLKSRPVVAGGGDGGRCGGWKPALDTIPEVHVSAADHLFP
uniref:Glutaminase-asparaginase n=1 Tax=Anthurium amnicola TaxID=1678845 RepID=A0A1D1XC78_9ARAE